MAYAAIPKPLSLSQLPTSNIVGVYFLWHAGLLVYVGQSKWLPERICQHLAEAVKVFDQVSWIECKAGRLNSMESHYIEILLPKYNNCSLSKRARREHQWGTPKVGKAPVFAVLEDWGLTAEQFQWLVNHPKGPKPRKVRIPRRNVRRSAWFWDGLEQWRLKNDRLLEQAKTI